MQEKESICKSGDTETDTEHAGSCIRHSIASTGGESVNTERKIKTELYCDNFQNYKRYGIPKAQLVIADIPYNLGKNAYASNPMWYNGGDNKNGESKLAGKAFFNTDHNFNIAEYFHFCNRLLKKEPKEKKKAPCMIVFCSFQQMPMIIEYALILYRDKLPKYNNNGKMQFDWMEWRRDKKKDVPKVHPTQKPTNVIKRLIELFTDEGDVVIDPVAGSGVTLRCARELGRSSYGFEVSKEFYNKAVNEMLAVNEWQEPLF